MAFVNPWWLANVFPWGFHHRFEFPKEAWPTDNSDIFFKGEEFTVWVPFLFGNIQSSLPSTQALSVTCSFGWLASLLRKNGFAFAIVLTGTWLSMTSAVALFTESLAGIGEQVWEGKGSSCLFLTSAHSPLLFKSCSPQLSITWRAWSLLCVCFASTLLLDLWGLGIFFGFCFWFLFTFCLLD